MRSENTDENTLPGNRSLPGEADYEAAVAQIIAQLTTNWRVTDKPAVRLPETDGWFPPSRPRRGCEDC